jgi:hypothetical protein
VRLYHERADHRSGALGAGDEEECFTPAGRRTGIYLTTEALTGESVVSATIAASTAAPFEVTGDDREHRVFVVPAAVAVAWRFR